MTTYFYRFLISERASHHNSMRTVHEYVPDLSSITNPRTWLKGYESDWIDDDLRVILKDTLTDEDWQYTKEIAISNGGGRGDYENGHVLENRLAGMNSFQKRNDKAQGIV